MIDSRMRMDGNWDKGYTWHGVKEGLDTELWVSVSFVSQRLNMFLITRYLIIHIEVGFTLHFSLLSFPLSLIRVDPGLAKHPKVGRRFGVSVGQRAFG